MRIKTLTRNNRVQPRVAFTLVEIMVAIVIVAILMSLLLPALGRARTTARIQEVKTDIDKMTTGLTQFKARFSVDIPGTVTLYEKGTSWAAAGEAARSRGIIRQIWPTFSFGDIDLNGNGTLGETSVTIQLDGAECLVFFLGGMKDPASGALIGFSKNPVNPFVTGGNREGPFFEFKSDRLVDRDGDGYMEYLDPIPGQQEPYLYFANGYRVIVDPNNSAQWVNADAQFGHLRMPRAYYQTIAGATVPLGAQSNPHNKTSFQIISPGFDFSYGVGGVYNPNSPVVEDANNNGVLDTTSPTEDANNNGVLDLSEADRDNITNFSRGQLVE